jgi:hypothetical protein
MSGDGQDKAAEGRGVVLACSLGDGRAPRRPFSFAFLNQPCGRFACLVVVYSGQPVCLQALGI